MEAIEVLLLLVALPFLFRVVGFVVRHPILTVALVVLYAIGMHG